MTPEQLEKANEITQEIKKRKIYAGSLEEIKQSCGENKDKLKAFILGVNFEQELIGFHIIEIIDMAISRNNEKLKLLDEEFEKL